MNKQELIWDVETVLAEMETWRPVYLALLQVTKDKNEAALALRFLIKIKSELDKESRAA